MAIFITGATGYLGSSIAAELLNRCGDALNLLVRASNQDEAQKRLWRALQLHMDFPEFYRELSSRMRIFLGDVTRRRLGLPQEEYDELVKSTDSVIHCAASLNRKSERSCLNVNLRGTLEVIKLARDARDHHGLRRFSHLSTVAVAGQRRDEIVREDEAIDWNRPDYDPYARTKKFCEHMVRELLEDVSTVIFRPSIVLGDSRRAETTQFDMVRAFVFLAQLPVLPLRPDDKVDIVPADFVAQAVAAIHLKGEPRHDTYHLSSGADSETFRRITDAMSSARICGRPLYVPALERPFNWIAGRLSNWRGPVGYGASLLKVFMPYLVWNTVFANDRIKGETGLEPAPFSSYCYKLFRFAKDGNFTYNYRDWPAAAKELAR
jgi:thioester reductase-like protein